MMDIDKEDEGISMEEERDPLLVFWGLLGNKWKLAIISVLLTRESAFWELRYLIHECQTEQLAKCLWELQVDGIVASVSFWGGEPKYYLTGIGRSADLLFHH